MTFRTRHVLSSSLVVILFVVGGGPARPEQPPKQEKEILTIRTKCWGVKSLALSPDGKRIITSNSEIQPFPQYLLIHDADTGKTLRKSDPTGDGVIAVSFTPDGKRVAGTLPGKVVFWDAATGKRDVEYEVGIKNPLGLAFTPDYAHFVVGGGAQWNNVSRSRRGDIKVFQAHTGKQVFDLKGQGSLVTSVAVTADGKRIVSGGWNGTAKVWDLGTGKELLDINGQNKAVRSVAFSPDGKHIAGGGMDRVVVVWDADSGRVLTTYTGHTEVMSLTFSPDGKRIVSGGEDTLIKVWAVPTK